MSEPLNLTPHVAFVNGEDVEVLHPTSCKRVERDGYFEMHCGVDYQIRELGWNDATGITEDGCYMLDAWFVNGGYNGPYVQDPDFGIEVTQLVEKTES